MGRIMTDNDRDNIATLIEQGVADETICQVLGWSDSLIRKFRCAIDYCKQGNFERGLSYVNKNIPFNEWLKKRFNITEQAQVKAEPVQPDDKVMDMLSNINNELVAIRLLLEKLL